MNKLIIAIIVIALGVLGWYYYGNPFQQGDAVESTVSESQEMEKTDVETAKTNMVGTWKSSDDEKSVVIFKADGTTVDVYNGEELGGGSWEITEGEDYEGSGLHLRTVINDEEYNYAVWSVDENELTINYLERGNTLNYMRVDGDVMIDVSL